MYVKTKWFVVIFAICKMPNNNLYRLNFFFFNKFPLNWRGRRQIQVTDNSDTYLKKLEELPKRKNMIFSYFCPFLPLFTTTF